MKQQELQIKLTLNLTISLFRSLVFKEAGTIVNYLSDHDYIFMDLCLANKELTKLGK